MTNAEFAGKRALLVGGTSGIGLETARLLLERGAASVCVVGRDGQRGKTAAESLARDGTAEAVRFVQADCGDPAQARRMAEEAGEAMGGIDILVTSAGGGHLPEILMRMEIETVRDAVLSGLLPHLLACRAVLPRMAEAGQGAIVTIASDAAKVATPGETAIGACMAGIVQYTRTLAIEGKRNGIRANCVTPSLVEGTPLTERLMAEGTFSSRLFAKARPLAGLGPTTARDVAELAAFLAGPRAERITGQAVSVNGGISAA